MVDHVWLGPTHGCVTHLPQSPTRTGLHCWGANDGGQLDGTHTPHLSAFRVTTLGEPKQLSLGLTHSCGVFDKSVVRCWGRSATLDLVEKHFAGRPEADDVRVAVTDGHSCVHSQHAHEIACFGANEQNQVGTKDVWNRDADIRSFAMGAAHMCAAFAPSASAIEQVECRGRSMPAKAILAGVPVKQLAAGGDHSCALLHDGSVRCWGKNDEHQLGDGTTNTSTDPVAAVDVKGAVQIALGARHSCVLLWNGTVACWGDNSHHQLANGLTTSTGHAGVIVGLVQVKELVAAGDGSCVRLEDRSVRCWGLNDRHQLGNGSTVEQSVPMSIHYE